MSVCLYFLITVASHEASEIEFASSFISFVEFPILLFYVHSGTISTAVGTNYRSAGGNYHITVDS